MTKFFQKALELDHLDVDENVFFIDESNLKAHSCIFENFKDQAYILNGPAGIGKTHLAKKWIEQHPDQVYINCKNEFDIELTKIKYVSAVVVDNLDFASIRCEKKIFYVYNACLKYNIKILFIFKSFFIMKLIDLRSVMNSIKILNIDEHTNFITRSIIGHCFSLKNIFVKENIINAVLDKYNKGKILINKNILNDFIDKLFNFSIANNCTITIKLIKQLDF